MICMVATVSFLAACSSKPPDCADEKTLNLIKGLIVENSKDMSNRVDGKYRQDAVRYVDALKIEIQNIVSDGYNAEAKKHSCTGAFVITTLNAMTFTGSQSYTSQATAGDSSKFVVNVPGIESLFNTLNNDLGTYVVELGAKR